MTSDNKKPDPIVRKIKDNGVDVGILMVQMNPVGGMEVGIQLVPGVENKLPEILYELSEELEKAQKQGTFDFY